MRLKSKENDVSKDEIIKFIKSNKRSLCSEFHLEKIGLFGSFSRGENNSHSDIDIIIEFDDQQNNIYETKQNLKKLFRERFNRDVDIAREKYLKKRVKEAILKETIYV